MTLQELINKRNALSFEQLETLERILTEKLHKKDKLRIREILKNKFYTTFDKLEFSKEVQVYESKLEWIPGEHRINKLKEVRKVLLS